jgi:hypothetical protein
MGLAVNNFGWLPSNPDVNLDVNSTGGGTERPLGFTFSQIFNLYWTVKSLSVSADVLVQPNVSTGGISSIVEAMSSISSAQQQLQGTAIGLKGNTIISTAFKQEIRSAKINKNNEPTDIDYYTSEGIKNNELITSVRRKTQLELTDAAQRGYLTQLVSNQSTVNEGTLLSSGPIHKLRTSGGAFTLDLSSIIYRQRLYWPKIIIIFDAYSSLSNNGILISGGINMFGGIIPMYMDMAAAYRVLYAVAIGVITIGKRPLDRFYYDGKDKERSN